MSLLTILNRKWLAVGRRLRAARIRRLERSIDQEREHADSYLAGRVELLDKLKAQQDGRAIDDRTSEQVRRDVERSAKFQG